MVCADGRLLSYQTELTSTDVDIKIEACGVCGSDVHTISGKFPRVVRDHCKLD